MTKFVVFQGHIICVIIEIYLIATDHYDDMK